MVKASTTKLARIIIVIATILYFVGNITETDYKISTISAVIVILLTFVLLLIASAYLVCIYAPFADIKRGEESKETSKSEVMKALKNSLIFLVIYELLLLLVARFAIIKHSLQGLLEITPDINLFFYSAVLQSSAAFLAVTVALTVAKYPEGSTEKKASLSNLFPSIIFIMVSVIISILVLPSSSLLDYPTQKALIILTIFNAILGYSYLAKSLFKEYTKDMN